MKPKRIFLVRHGESEGNVDKSVYRSKPDYSLLLTDKGKEQANDAGKKLKEIIGDETLGVYYSPFFRTRQTADTILSHFDPNQYNIRDIKEEPRIREQEWSGKLREKGFNTNAELERDAYGHFYYRFEEGESCADVYDRVSDFFNTLHRDFTKESFPDNVIISGHGLSNRVFLMRWFHLSVTSFEYLANPKNCQIWEFDRYFDMFSNDYKYKCVSDIPLYESLTHEYIYPFNSLKSITQLAESSRDPLKYIPNDIYKQNN